MVIDRVLFTSSKTDKNMYLLLISLSNLFMKQTALKRENMPHYIDRYYNYNIIMYL